MLLIIVLYLLVAITIIIAKYSTSVADPLFFISARLMIAGLLLLVGYSIFSTNSWKIHKSDWIYFIQAIVFFSYLTFVLEFWVLPYVSALNVSLLYSLTPFITFVLAYLMFRETISGIQIWGSLIAFGSIIPLITKNGRMVRATLAPLSWTDMVILLAATCGSYGWFCVQRLLKKGYSLLFISGISMFFGGLLSLVTWSLTSAQLQNPISNSSGFWLALIALIIVSNIVVFNLYGYLMKTFSITTLSVWSFVSPLFTSLFSILFLHETLEWQHLVAFIGLTIGLYLFMRRTCRICLLTC